MSFNSLDNFLYNELLFSHYERGYTCWWLREKIEAID